MKKEESDGDSLGFENDDTFAIDYLVHYNESMGREDESIPCYVHV